MEEPSFETLSLEADGPVTTLYLDRPEKRNAMNPQMFFELGVAASYLAEKDDARIIIITGRGKAFSSGIDLAALAEFSQFPSRKLRAFVKLGQRSFRSYETMEKPVIAMVNGPALGAGMEIALASDMIFASTSSTFGLLETKYGIIPDLGATQRLPRMIGIHRAKEMVLTGKSISAEEAERIGLLNRLLPPEVLEQETRKMAADLVQISRDALGLGKMAVNRSRDGSTETGLEFEAQAQTICFTELQNTMRGQKGDSQ